MTSQARELSHTERQQICLHQGLQPADGKVRVKCAERASRSWKLPEAGEVVIIEGVEYAVDGQGKAWTSGKDMVCYLYLVPVAEAVAEPAPAPAPKAKRLATPKQVAFAIKLGATNADVCYDAMVDGRAFTRAQLEAMSMDEISVVIADLRN